MKGLLKMAVYPAAGLLAFVLALCIILATKGQLNASLLKKLPVVGKTPDNEPAAKEEPVQTVSTMRYFTSEELAGMLREATALKQRTESDANAVAEREKRLEIMKADLQKERQELMNIRNQLDAARAGLKKSEDTLAEHTMEVEQLEAAGLRRSALIHESMDSKKAAAALAVLPQPNAAKLLSFMDEKKAARILQEMPPESASELLSLLKQVKATPETQE